MNIDEVRKLTKLNLQIMVDALPKILAKREIEFFQKINQSNLSNLKKLEKLYSFMDVLYKHVNRFTPCKKHCSYCCYYEITISDIEIEYIEKTNKKIRRTKHTKTSSKDPSKPCSFLRKNCCLIYESRPYVCRRHIILTPDNSICTPENAHKYKIQSFTFTELDKSYDFIRATSASTEFFDIRDVFKLKQ